MEVTEDIGLGTGDNKLSKTPEIGAAGTAAINYCRNPGTYPDFVGWHTDFG